MKGSKFEVVCMRQKKNKNANKLSVTKNSYNFSVEVVKNLRVYALIGKQRAYGVSLKKAGGIQLVLPGVPIFWNSKTCTA